MDRLRKDSLLDRDPTREEVIALAQMYSRRPMYLSLFDFPEKEFFGDLLSALDSMGLVKPESLYPRAILNVADVRLESIFPRMFGWRIQAGLQHRSFQKVRKVTGHRGFARGSIDYLVLAAEYGHDVSLWTHVIAEFQWKASITPRIKKRQSVEASVFLSHELTDRIESSLGYSYDWGNDSSIPIDVSGASSHLIGTFRFYLENRVMLFVSASYGQVLGGNVLQNEERTNFGMSFGLNYRFF
jgi:hypothetical protein